MSFVLGMSFKDAAVEVLDWEWFPFLCGASDDYMNVSKYYCLVSWKTVR